jgi:hypothetical protein
VSNCRGARVLEVVLVSVYEGKGTKEDPGRIVNYYFDKGGYLVAVQDHTKHDLSQYGMNP